MNLDDFVTFDMPSDPAPYIRHILAMQTHYARWSHADAAERFARMHLHSLLYHRDSCQWFFWNGKRKRWERDALPHILKALENFLALYGQAALCVPGGKREQQRINARSFVHGTWAFVQHKQEFFLKEFPAGDAL
jgi:hypothetical protein